MIRIIIVLVLTALLYCGAQAQFSDGIKQGNRYGFTSPTVSGSAPFVGLGDAVAESAYGYWGVREYNVAYGTGNAVVVCDSATFAICSTINYLSTGYMDAATAAGSSACAVACVAKEIFDSTGNAHHATCASAAACATVTFSCHGAYPCYVCATACAYTLASSVLNTNPYTVSYVGERTTGTGAFGGVCCTATFGLFYRNAANGMQLFNDNAVNFTAPDSTWNSIQGVLNGASSFSYVNGTNTALATPGTDQAQINTLGNVNGNGATMNFLELAMYNGVAFTTTDASNANTNQHAAYGGL